MNINLTLIGQSISFLFFAWFCWKVIWPKFSELLEKRQAAIAAGLKAAEQGTIALQEAKLQSSQQLDSAKQKANEIVQFAKNNAGTIEEQAKQKAATDATRIREAAQKEADAMRDQLKEEMRRDVGTLAALIAEQIIKEKVDAQLHDRLITDMAKQL